MSLCRPSRAITDNLAVSKRDWIYVGLMVFITVGFVVDALVWTAGPTAVQWNSVVQSFGIMLFVYWWESADADQFGKRRSSLARLLTFFLPPVGHAIYLYQSRPWKSSDRAVPALLGRSFRTLADRRSGTDPGRTLDEHP